jgi:hypothetical protein
MSVLARDPRPPRAAVTGYWIWVAVFIAFALGWAWPVVVAVWRWPHDDEILSFGVADDSDPDNDPGSGEFGD